MDKGATTLASRRLVVRFSALGRLIVGAIPNRAARCLHCDPRSRDTIYQTELKYLSVVEGKFNSPVNALSNS